MNYISIKSNSLYYNFSKLKFQVLNVCGKKLLIENTGDGKGKEEGVDRNQDKTDKRLIDIKTNSVSAHPGEQPKKNR